ANDQEYELSRSILRKKNKPAEQRVYCPLEAEFSAAARLLGFNKLSTRSQELAGRPYFCAVFRSSRAAFASPRSANAVARSSRRVGSGRSGLIRRSNSARAAFASL